MTDLEIRSAVLGLKGVLGAVGFFYPPVKVLSPVLLLAIQEIADKFIADRASGEIVPDGQGGWVNKRNLTDPRLILNPDGTFKN